MKVTAIETLRLEAFPNLLWVRVGTDEGLTGLGETFLHVAPVETYVHDVAAPVLLGRDPLRIDRIWRDLSGHLGASAPGAEVRGRSAIDIALWDLLGKAAGYPVYQMLGGLTHDRVRTYNSCAGSRYIVPREWDPDFRGLVGGSGPYEDFRGILEAAEGVAHSLLEQGITAMKLWPLDFAAWETDGREITRKGLVKALEPIRRIREAVGDRMDILVDMHGEWDPACAVRIARACEPYDPYWYEDPVRTMSDVGAVAEFARRTPVRTVASESLATREAFRDLFERRATAVAMLDPGWCGGISEARKIAQMAESYQIPFSPHDCVGPVQLLAGIHLCLNATNTLIQESVRAYYLGWYAELVTHVPTPVDGHFLPPDGPGLGTELLPDRFSRDDVVRRVSSV